MVDHAVDLDENAEDQEGAQPKSPTSPLLGPQLYGFSNHRSRLPSTTQVFSNSAAQIKVSP